MKPTLVFIRHHQIGGRQFHHGSELPPGILTDHEIDQWLDQGRLREYPDRRSLFRLLPAFSGCDEREPLTKDDIAAHSLPE